MAKPRTLLAPGSTHFTICLLAFLLPSQLMASTPFAFPGALGQGAASTGGRGGNVYHVTTLEDYHPQRDEKIPGSLRHAIRSAEAPRTIVFDVGGAIALVEPLEILKSDLTIAGQTAPGPGVTLWGYPLEISRGSNIIVRYLRVRTGDFHARTDHTSKPHPYDGNGDLDPGSSNAINVGGDCQLVILDHISASWGMDETLSVTKCCDVTIQHCMIAASLNDSFHPKGAHGYGTLVRGELTPEDQASGRGGFTFYGNLWTHHRARNPSIGGQQRIRPGTPESQRRMSDVNLVNNVVYNWRDQPTHRSQQGTVRINLLGNYYINGPEKDADRVFNEGDPNRTVLYHAGNAIDADQDSQHNGTLIETAELVDRSFRKFGPEDELIGIEQGRPLPFLHLAEAEILSAEEAYQQVVAGVGCSLNRDAVDLQTIESLTGRTGRLIDSQEELRDAEGVLRGIDDLPETHRPSHFDSDNDGMSDEFETRHGLDPADPTDGNGTQLSPQGYTNLEVYLHELTQE